jgi:hypothetical protein
MTTKEFEAACSAKICGDLWDDTFNKDYQEEIPLTVHEMRYIANLLRLKEGLKLLDPIDPWEESDTD